MIMASMFRLLFTINQRLDGSGLCVRVKASCLAGSIMLIEPKRFGSGYKPEPASYIPIVSSQRIEVKLLIEVDSLRLIHVYM